MKRIFLTLTILFSLLFANCSYVFADKTSIPAPVDPQSPEGKQSGSESEKKELLDAEVQMTAIRNAQLLQARKDWKTLGPNISQAIQETDMMDKTQPTRAPEIAAMRINLGLQLWKVGMYSEASKQFETGSAKITAYSRSKNPLKLAPNKLEALVVLNALAKIELANIDIVDKKYAPAKTLLNQVLQPLLSDAKMHRRSERVASIVYTDLAIISISEKKIEQARKYVAESKRHDLSKGMQTKFVGRQLSPFSDLRDEIELSDTSATAPSDSLTSSLSELSNDFSSELRTRVATERGQRGFNALRHEYLPNEPTSSAAQSNKVSTKQKTGSQNIGKQKSSTFDSLRRNLVDEDGESSNSK